MHTNRTTMPYGVVLPPHHARARTRLRERNIGSSSSAGSGHGVTGGGPAYIPQLDLLGPHARFLVEESGGAQGSGWITGTLRNPRSQGWPYDRGRESDGRGADKWSTRR